MQSFVDAITSFNNFLNGIVWGPPLLILLVGTGIMFTFRSRFLQVRKLGVVLKNTIGQIFVKQDTEEGAITPFQAMTTALAGTIGTGNIVGVTSAIVAGGPGAVFWMWVSAFFGMMTKYAEVVLAVKYRERNEKGEWSGGPMYYITNGMGKKWKPMAVIFAIFAMLASFGIGNATQVNSIASSVNTAFGVPMYITGIIVAVLTALVIIGGIKSIGKVTEKLVPFMSVVYIIAALIVVIGNIRNIPLAFGQIFAGAFSLKSVGGGIGGYIIMRAMNKGVARGVFSNEAGLGSAPIAHAATSETDPVRQGMYGIFEVFIDTIVVCTLTALVVMTAQLFEMGGELDKAPLIAASMGTVLGANFGNIIIALAISLFAFSTIISWSYYGAKCTEYLFGPKAVLPYRIVYLAIVVVGSIAGSGLVWDIADTLNGMMAIPNLIALIALSGVVMKLTNESFLEKKI